MLESGAATAKRMKVIVRKAQRDPHFAMIYEQRKTNQILAAGFANLGQALNQITSQIEDSVERLSNSLDSMNLSIDESKQSTHFQMGNTLDATIQFHEDFLEQASEQATREHKVAEMLDNIQRGRKPLY
jgi:hypothetical protein